MHVARRAKVALELAGATAPSRSIAKRTVARLIRPLVVIESDRRAQSGSRAAQPASIASAPLRRLSTVARSEPSRAERDDIAGCIPRASYPSRSPLRVPRASMPEISRSLEDLSVRIPDATLALCLNAVGVRDVARCESPPALLFEVAARKREVRYPSSQMGPNVLTVLGDLHARCRLPYGSAIEGADHFSTDEYVESFLRGLPV
jgi:hypothetical protein